MRLHHLLCMVVLCALARDARSSVLRGAQSLRQRSEPSMVPEQDPTRPSLPSNTSSRTLAQLGDILGAASDFTKFVQKILECDVTTSAAERYWNIINPFSGQISLAQAIELLVTGPTLDGTVCCIGSFYPTLLEKLYLAYIPSVSRYNSDYNRRKMSGMTLLALSNYLYPDFNNVDLSRVTVHYGHVFEAALFSGCMTIGYDIYCNDQSIPPPLLVHELYHVKQFVEAGSSKAQFGKEYLRQWCTAKSYTNIPWEVQADNAAAPLLSPPNDDTYGQYCDSAYLPAKWYRFPDRTYALYDMWTSSGCKDLVKTFGSDDYRKTDAKQAKCHCDKY